jgi:hypothetical protein
MYYLAVYKGQQFQFHVYLDMLRHCQPLEWKTGSLVVYRCGNTMDTITTQVVEDLYRMV